MGSEEFWSHWAWPAATAALGFVYVWLLVEQWLARRKPHQLAWAVGFFLYAVAAVFEAYSEYTGNWDPFVYRIYIVFAASLVGFLGLGTLYLITKKRWIGHSYLIFNLIGLAIFFYGTFTAELVMAKLVPGITVGGQALGESMSFPRVMSFWFNIPGSLLSARRVCVVGGQVLAEEGVPVPLLGQCAHLHRHASDRRRRFDGARGDLGRSVSSRDGGECGTACRIPHGEHAGEGREDDQEAEGCRARTYRVTAPER